MVPVLGKLERVNLREVWANEATVFTPWLASPDNIKLLGEAIGMELQVEAQERPVGPFRADILCRNAGSAAEEWVLVENQLERTDHCHLGQLITYAAGLETATIVWIAERFTDEHRAAIDWLNKITAEDFQFFGLEIEAWRIGNSLAAPKFNVVCKPNDWSKDIKVLAEGGTSVAKTLQLDFWTLFLRRLAEAGHEKSRIPRAKAVSSLPFTLGRTGYWVAAVASIIDWEKRAFSGELRVEFCVNVPQSREYFELFRQRRTEIEAVLGEQILFSEKEDVRMRRIMVRTPVELEDRDRWEGYFDWLQPRLVKFLDLFGKLVRELELPPANALPTEADLSER